MDKLKLPRDGVEYITFTLANLPTGTYTLEAQISEAGTWTAVDVSTGTPRLLVCGPDVPVGNRGGAVVVLDDSTVRIRVKNAPQIIVRGAGYVALTR